MACFFFATLSGAILLVVLSIWPGLLECVVLEFPFCLGALPLLGTWVVLTITFLYRDLFLPEFRDTKRPFWGPLSALVVGITYLLLWLHAPQRIAACISAPAFLRLVEQPPPPPHKKAPGGWVGCYRVQEWWVDGSGNAYFETASVPVGIGDSMHYGLAYRPSMKGTPDPSWRSCEFLHVYGDWYLFKGYFRF
jgi:hypothetical protein